MPNRADYRKRQTAGATARLHCYRRKSVSRPATQGRLVEVPVFRLEPKAEVLKDQVELAGKEAAQFQAARRDVSFLANMHDSSGWTARFAARRCTPSFPRARPLRHHAGPGNGRAHSGPTGRPRKKTLAGCGLKTSKTNRPSSPRWLLTQRKSWPSAAESRKNCNVLNGIMISAKRRPRSKLRPSAATQSMRRPWLSALAWPLAAWKQRRRGW